MRGAREGMLRLREEHSAVHFFFCSVDKMELPRLCSHWMDAVIIKSILILYLNSDGVRFKLRPLVFNQLLTVAKMNHCG